MVVDDAPSARLAAIVSSTVAAAVLRIEVPIAFLIPLLLVL